MNEIRIRQFSADICEVFEDLLDKYNITVPDKNRLWLANQKRGNK